MYAPEVQRRSFRTVGALPEHQKWVLDLATQLRENGVDVTVDKWDLKEGHDAIKFMEKMVTDPEIKKVIVVLDRTE